MIQPTSSRGLSLTDLGLPNEPVKTSNPELPVRSITTANGNSADLLSKFNTVFGAPSQWQNLHHEKNGHSGGYGTTKAHQADPLAGVKLTGQKGVIVQHSLGDPDGYQTKNHALAWARSANSDRAMVMLDKKGNWHAVETNVVAKSASGLSGKVTIAIQVGNVDQTKYDNLKAQAMKDNDASHWKTFAAYALGLPESEINVIYHGQTPSKTKVNINLSPYFNAEGRVADFDAKNPPSVELGPSAFDRPANACATLAHEEVHADHYRETSKLFSDYQRSAHGKDTFRMWAAKTQTVRTADIVAGVQDRTFAATELEAYVEAAKVAFASGDLTQARTDLTKVANRRTLPLLQTQMVSIDTLKTMRDGLPSNARTVFDDVVKQAKSSSVLSGL